MTTGELKRSYYDYRAQRARVEALFKIEPTQTQTQQESKKWPVSERLPLAT